jgi:hypothetical protein
MKLKGKMKDRIRKTLRRWLKKLSVGLAAVGNIDRTNKTIKLAAVVTIAAVAATATTQASGPPVYVDRSGNSFDTQNTGGYYYDGYQDWSVWGSIINALRSPYVWMAGLGGLSHSFDASPDPGQTYWRSSSKGDNK